MRTANPSKSGSKGLKWGLLLAALVACRPTQKMEGSMAYPVKVAQACGDVMLPVDKENVRSCDVLELRFQFPGPVRPDDLKGITLVNQRTGQQVMLRAISADATNQPFLLAESFRSTFTYDAPYLLTIKGVKDTTGIVLPRASLNLHTEKSPYFFRWLETQVKEEAGPYVEALMRNTTGESVPAGAVVFSVVCDQERQGQRQTVYFKNDSADFANGETRTVRLTLDQQHSFQPAPWKDVGFTQCRNKYLEGTGARRAYFDHQR